MIPREILEKVRRIEIKTRSIVDASMSGEYKSAFKGKGMEFSEVRTYTEGDDVRSVDWNVTARMGEPYIKKHVEERELTVMLVVDASASGMFGSVDKMKSEAAVELCAVLAFSAIKNNDRVGLIIFTSEIETFVPPKKGRNHVLRVIRELLYFKPGHSGTSIDTALGYLRQVQRKRAVVFLVSDFIDSDFETPLRVAARRYDLIAAPVGDPREEELPNVGLLELRDPETGEQMLVDTGNRAFRERYASLVAERRRRLQDIFRTAGIDSIPVTTGSDYVEAVVKFFKRREKIVS